MRLPRTTRSNRSPSVPDTTAPSPRNKALDLLARREHSVAELRAKLLVREFEPDTVELAIDQLVHEGLVSDERFADAFVTARARKGQGPVKIRAELSQRGVADGLIETSIGEVDVDWFAIARQVRERKYGEQSPTDYKERARQSRFLQSRGFTMEQISGAFRPDH